MQDFYLIWFSNLHLITESEYIFYSLKATIRLMQSENYSKEHF